MEVLTHISVYTARPSLLRFLESDELDAQFLFLYSYFSSVHVSSNLVLIIRRISCINTTSDVCHSV
jgi:hypothetical protein